LHWHSPPCWASLPPRRWGHNCWSGCELS
jgi:hypothetical protein